MIETDRVIKGVCCGVGFVTIVILAGCSPWGVAEGGVSPRSGDPNVQKEATASLTPSSEVSAVYVAVTAEDRASIKGPENCGPEMGRGGNFTEGPHILKGKCNGGGLSPRIEYDHTGSHFLSFAIDPERSVAGKRDRTELAFVRRYFPFYEQLYIGFRLMIPEGVDSTDEFFYALQLWQCAGLSPIAGVRVERDTSHTINFMTRNQEDGRSRAKFDLKPGQWHEFVLHIVPGPAGDALFHVFADGELLVRSLVPYGFSAADACGESPNEQRYRVKFGIYKGGEPGKRFAVNYDDFTIADRYETVAVPLGWDPDRMPSDESKALN
jgi:hypothetical protein